MNFLLIGGKTSITDEIAGFWRFLSAPETIAKVVNTVLSIALILGIGLLLNFVLKKAIYKILDPKKKRNNKTIAMIISNGAKYLIYFFMICAILEQFGISTSSILAVAGVGSVAIGFGAQSLVKDVITGIFLIAEEQFRLDDIIEVNGKTGKVESIGLRTTTFRNVVNSEVYIIPNSEINFVTNLTKDYHRAVVNIEIPFEPNLDETLLILQQAMEAFDGGEDILAQPEVQGITDFVESAMNVRIICDCKSGKAFHIERQIRRFLKNYIESKGVFIPYSTRTIHVIHEEKQA